MKDSRRRRVKHQQIVIGMVRESLQHVNLHLDLEQQKQRQLQRHQHQNQLEHLQLNPIQLMQQNNQQHQQQNQQQHHQDVILVLEDCIPSSGAPAGTTTTAPVSPVNTPAPSGNIGGLGAQITAGETSTTPAPIFVRAQPHLPPQTNIIDGLDPSRSELTEKQLTELFGESVTSMEPDSGSNSDSSPNQKTIIIEKETAEETVDGGMPGWFRSSDYSRGKWDLWWFTARKCTTARTGI